MEVEEKNYKNILKSNVISFFSYTVLIGFIFLIVVFLIKSALSNISNVYLSICLSLICGILIYHTLHFICKSCTIDSFKKSKLDSQNSNMFLKNMNLIFVAGIIISVILCINYIVIDNFIYINALNRVYNEYEFISPELAEKIINNIQENYQNKFLSKISSIIITELSLTISFISLIPYQKKLLSKYNK